MKLLIALLLAFSCSKKEDDIMGYVTGSWFCEKIYSGQMGTNVYDCTNIMTGKKADIIYNATFVVPVKKNEEK